MKRDRRPHNSGVIRPARRVTFCLLLCLVPAGASRRVSQPQDVAARPASDTRDRRHLPDRLPEGRRVHPDPHDRRLPHARVARPAARKDQGADIDEMSVTLDQIWHPNIEVTNQHAPREIANAMLTVDDDGMVTYEERFKAELSTDFDLQRFPFDRQRLLLRDRVVPFHADRRQPGRARQRTS